MKMIKVKQINACFKKGKLLPKRKILEISILDEMQQDCYSYFSFDSPSELKRMILQEVSKKIDQIIINDAPKYINKQILINKLNKIKIMYYGTENS